MLQPRLFEFRSLLMLPLLRSEATQNHLRDHAPPQLRLKLNSHWVLDDMIRTAEDTGKICLEETCTEVDYLLGPSPRLLSLLNRVTRHTLKQTQHLGALEALYEDLNFLRKQEQDIIGKVNLIPWERVVLNMSSMAHILASQIYLLCRTRRWVKPS